MFIKKLMEKLMAKKKKEFLQEIAPVGEEEVDESTRDVQWEPPLDLPEDEEKEDAEGKMDKQKFLDSIGLGERPGSQLAADKWKEYLGI
jgi:hypothetical protein